jgi:hypothetical protein
MTIMALEKNVWERVDNVVTCGYSEDMNNETITYRNIKITNIRRPQLLRIIPINYGDGLGEITLPSIAKAQGFIDFCIANGATVANGTLVQSMDITDLALFGSHTSGGGYIQAMKAGK